jgi:hypothetical protein
MQNDTLQQLSEPGRQFQEIFEEHHGFFGDTEENEELFARKRAQKNRLAREELIRDYAGL